MDQNTLVFTFTLRLYYGCGVQEYSLDLDSINPNVNLPYIDKTIGLVTGGEIKPRGMLTPKQSYKLMNFLQKKYRVTDTVPVSIEGKVGNCLSACLTVTGPNDNKECLYYATGVFFSIFAGYDV